MMDDNVEKFYKVKFGKLFISKPVIEETDGETRNLFPMDARLR